MDFFLLPCGLRERGGGVGWQNGCLGPGVRLAPRTVPFFGGMMIPAVSIEVPGVIKSAAIKCYFVHNEKDFFFFSPLLVNFSHYWAEQNGWRFLLKLFLLLCNFDSDIK